MKLRTVLFAVVLALLPSLASPQATATGIVTGRVTDSSGAVLPGVTISFKSPEALGQYTAVSDAQGIYRVSSLQPATYEARAELQGFQAVVHTVTVRVGTTVTVDFTLPVGSMAETVVVTGEAPIVDPERAGLSVNINNTALTSLPISTQRRYQDIWALVPGVYVRPDETDINPSVNSRGTSENSTKLDGMDVTDPFGGGVFSVNFNYDAIQDIQVKTLGAEAEDGARTGGFMTIVTKSGGNELHGSAAFFVIPQRFNSSNVKGIPANQRKDYQPDFTLGGPIMRDRIWFFGAYRRAQEDQTLNNAPVPREKRGNLVFVKATSQLQQNHRLAWSFQWDRTTMNNAVMRGLVAPGRTLASTSGGLSSATPQQVAPSAFGKQIVGGPLVGANYTWVVSETKLFQFVFNYMINKPQNAEPSGALGPTKVIQTNPAGNIAGSLTTIAQEGSLGVIDKSERSMLYLSPSFSFSVNRWGWHDFKTGGDLYPFLRDKTSSELQPVEYYFRPPGTTGSADILFERRTFRNLTGTGGSVANESYEHYFGGYIQDRWKPRPNISVKAGFRIDSNKVYTKDRQKVLGALLPPGFPTVTADKELDHTGYAPNFGIAYDAGKLGVFRGTAGRYYEWIDLGGGDGTTHRPYVVATDILRASPRTVAPALNQTVLGPFPLGVAYGQGNKHTYTNEFSVGWEKKLPGTSSVGVTFLIKRTWDFNSGDDMNIIRDPKTGAFLGRPWPDYDTVTHTYNPNYQFQDFRTVQFMYTRNFAGVWGMNANYWYAIHARPRLRWNPTTDVLQFMGFSVDDDTNRWMSPRHQARFSSFVRLPYDFMVSGFYSFTQGPKSDVTTGDYPLNAVAPTVTLSNGRTVADPFFNTAYPRARRRGVDMLSANNVHMVNMRIEKTFTLPQGRKIELSADVFNMFNTSAAFGFISVDARAANFGQRTNTVPPRVGQLGVRFVF
jgi:hypothetical protein